jgi:voltage-gated potassium channel
MKKAIRDNAQRLIRNANQMSQIFDEIHSNKTVSMGWDVALLAAMVYTLFSLPAKALFNLDNEYIFFAPDIIISSLFCVDSFLLKRKGGEIYKLRPSRISAIFSALPLYSLFFMLGLGTGWMPILVANHLFRLKSLNDRFRYHFRNSIIGKGFRSVMMAGSTALVLHWLACLWVYLHPTPGIDQITQYNKALYWAITTLTTVGYGDVTPDNNVTRIFTMVVMMGGVLFYGLVIGQVSRYMLSSDKRKETEKEQLEALASLVKHYKIPPGLAQETYKYYRHHLAQAANEAEQKILDSLPTPLETEIRTYMAIKPISGVKLFNGCSHECLVETAQKLEQRFFSPGDHIIKSGEIGNAMFVIGHGQVVVHSGETILIELRDGHCFGETALIEQRERRNADVTAKSYCHLFRLSKEAFIELTMRHPELKANADSLVSKHVNPPAA